MVDGSTGGAAVRVLVTGGAGFIGHHLVGGLLARGHEVSVIDDFTTGHRSRLAPFGDRIALTEGSVLDPAALDEAATRCEVVFHEAAIASVVRSIEAPRSTNEVNVGGSIEVMLAAVRHGVRRVVFAGSSAVYGIPEQLPCRESQRPNPRSPYGAGKLAAEHYIHSLGELHGVETVVLRYFNVFGPLQDPASEYAAVVPRFVTSVLEGRRPIVNGSGEITRDYIHVDNVVEANLLASRPSSPSALTCNIASGSRYSLLELLRAVCDAAGRRLDPDYGPARPGDIQHSQADISVARQALGYTVAVPFEEGIARTVASYRGLGFGSEGTSYHSPLDGA
jgi:UDP-glucose 4-epimerase